MKSMQPRRNFLRETMKPSFLSRQTLAQASLQGECASAFISNSSSFLILTDGDSQILPLCIKNRFMTTPFLSRFNFPRGMVVMVQQMATIVAFFGVLSLIFGIIAENKKICDINEVSREKVDELTSAYQYVCLASSVSSSDNIQKRSYNAMVEICYVVGN